MIDFPASPTDGQIFSAANGVVYKYSATYSSWLAQNPTPPLGGTGDFCATGSSGPLTTSFATLLPATIISGNAGSVYSSSTGRYTPPAGRYCINASMSAYSVSAATNASLQLRKNGTSIGAFTATTMGANGQREIPITMNVDANGSDFFDIQGMTNPAGQAALVMFSAFPLTGMQGPTGGAPGPVVGDFVALLAGPTTLPTAPGTATTMPVVLGNSGGYYTPANGQWKPPAGRYAIIGSMTAINNAASSNTTINIRKNGTVIQAANGAAAAAGYWVNVNATIIADANGSDIFDLQVYGTGANTSAYNFTFQATPTQGMVGPQGPMGPIGQTQTVSFETGALATGSTIMPADDTIPQITEGDQYMTLAITPKSATSKLIIEVQWNGAMGNANTACVALFQDSAPNALAANMLYFPGAVNMTMPIRHVMTSGTTSATTFRVRAGPAAAATLSFNGYLGNRLLGGVYASSIVITEVP